MNPSDLSGFDPRVREQLSQLSLEASSTGSQSSQPAPANHSQQYHQPRHNTYTTHIHPRNTSYQRPNQDYLPTMAPPPIPPGLDAFPPLGSQRQAYPEVQAQPAYNPTMAAQSHTGVSAAQEFFSRARGRGRGRGGRGHQQSDRNYRNQDPPYNQRTTEQFHYQRTPDQFQNQVQSNNFSRQPPSRTQYSQNSGSQRGFFSREEQQFWRQKSILQADYLNFLINKSVTNSLTQQELKAKHTFRKKLEKIAQDLMIECVTAEVNLATTEVVLESYGSLSNSFGTTGCDMDLILLVRRDGHKYVDIPWQFQHCFGKALLGQGIGAKLLVNTHVPILQVCELPGEDLLSNLQVRQAKLLKAAEEDDEVEESEHGFGGLPDLTPEEAKQAAAALEQLDDTAINVPLPDSNALDNAKVEFVGDCGIQCDINFTKRVAIYNTKLLWTYGQCDPRVRPVILFIKNWAKARDINTPYQGTLSSYGWVMLGLHYLMNVANPPVIPNLQHAAREDVWSASANDMIEPFEGYDIAFVKDLERIEQIKAGMPRNKESMGGLLQGFFKYYAQNSGFRWTQDVISIRTPGGLLSKQFKAWTALKRSEDRQNVRHRYLLAIEDPFEIEHNVGRTVGHNGVVAIRDEFRRAWDMIDNVQRGQPGQESWIWIQRDKSQSGSGMDLISKAEKRGDLLRKDQEARKEKLAEMRRLAELQEESAKKENLQSGLVERYEWSHNGMLIEDEGLNDSIDLIEDTSKLIHNYHHQDEKVLKMRAKTTNRQRIVHHEEDDDHEYEQSDWNLDNTHDQTADLASPSALETAIDPQHAVGNKETEPEESVHHEWQPEIIAEDIQRQSTPDQLPKDSANSSPHSNKKVRFATYDDEAQVEQGEPEEDVSTVGPFIAWSQTSKAGRWLLSRDQLIRAGTYKPITFGEKGVLDATFRYNPYMTQDELDAKNEILETFYMDELHPRLPQSHTQSMNLSENPGGQDSTFANTESVQEWSPPTGKAQEELLKSWPVTGNIWWSALSSTGRWLLWRDRKITNGVWVEKHTNRPSLGERLSELYPYLGDKTFANVERMNNELDTFFVDIEFPCPRMDREERSASTAALYEAIEKVHEHRQSIEVQESQLVEAARDFGNKHPAVYDKPNQSVVEERDSVKANDISDQDEYLAAAFQPQWATTTDTGRWLHKRDQKMREGIWKDNLYEDSVNGHMNRLFPFDSNRSVQEQVKLNDELETFCSGFVLPGHIPYTNRDKEAAYQAILRIGEHRKDHNQTKRVGVLLDLFKNQESKDQMQQLYFQDKNPKQANTAKREAQALQNISQNLKIASDNSPNANRADSPNSEAAFASPSPPNVIDASRNTVVPINTADFVRQQRLAFYSQQSKVSDVVSSEKYAGDHADNPYDKEADAEGSLSHNPPLDTELFADQHQLLGTHSIDTLICYNQYDPVTTDESEYIPNTLLPKTWRKEFRNRRDEDPRIMPIPRTIDFPFDPRQIIDIETIRAGGNGCARGAFVHTTETDRHSWGGGGAMAQKMDKSIVGECADYESSKVWERRDGDDPVSMAELPYLNDIAT